MPLSAMSSFIVSFRDTRAVGLAQQVTDGEWTAEIAHDEGFAVSQRITVTPGQPATLDLAALFPGAGGVVVIGVKAVGGPLDVSCSSFEAVVPVGGSVCLAAPSGAGVQQVTFSTNGAQTAYADVMVVLAAGA